MEKEVNLYNQRCEAGGAIRSEAKEQEISAITIGCSFFLVPPWYPLRTFVVKLTFPRRKHAE
jgi:hypothetical protein